MRACAPVSEGYREEGQAEEKNGSISSIMHTPEVQRRT